MADRRTGIERSCWSYHDRHASRSELTVRKEDLRLRSIGFILAFCILHNTDDRRGPSEARPVADAAADWIFVRPMAPRHRLIHNRDGCGVGTISVREMTAP